MPLRVTKKCMAYVNVYLIFLFELCSFQEPSVWVFLIQCFLGACKWRR